MAVRALAAALFVAVFGLFLAQPLLQADDKPAPQRQAPVKHRPEKPHRTEPSPEPEPEPTPSPEETSTTQIPDRLAHRYPRACLRPVSSPGAFGLVAAYKDHAVTITTAAGDVRAKIRAPGGIVRPPLAWSPSGTVLAMGAQGLLWRPNGRIVRIGDVQHGLVQGSSGTWGWSPRSDCGVQVDESGALLAVGANPLVAGAGTVLLDEGTESFWFSPDGRKLGLVMNDGRSRSIWVASLVTNRMHLVRDFPKATCCISLGGWAPDGAGLFHWAGPGASVMADGWTLGSVEMDGDLHSWGTTIPGTPIARCSGRLLAVVGDDRHGGGGRIAVLRTDDDPSPLTSSAERISSFSCSPDGLFMVAREDARLSLIDASGDRIRFLTNVDTANGTWSEQAPEWGPPRTGILFVRSMHLQQQLWYLPEGSSDERHVVDLELRGRRSGRSAFDWSATSPNGAPAG
jgi:hypothetical protein